MELFLLCMPWLLLTLISFLLLRRLNKTNHRLPPGPIPLPLVGNILELGDQPHHALARLAKTHGPLMSLRLGSVLTVVASSPDTARDILQHHDAVLAARFIPDALHGAGHAANAIAWIPPGPKLRVLRKLCVTKLFTPLRLDALQLLRKQKVQQMMEYVSKLSARGVPVDVGRVAFTTSLNFLSCTIFSVDLVELESGSSQEFKNVIMDIMAAAAKPNVSDFFPVLAAADVQGVRRRMDVLFGRLDGVFDEQIDRRRQDRDTGEPAKNDFLDVLLDYQETVQEEGLELDSDTIRALLADLFSAGSDTSSNTVEWAMAELLQNPHCMAKAQDELASVIGSRKQIEEYDINQLTYLQAVVKETFRLHPPLPLLLPRRAQATVQVHGYTIPEGTRVLVNVWAIGHDSEIWHEPEKFMPERFLEKEVDFRGRDFELIPFGAGRRICVGLPLAFRMIHLMLASLLHTFIWTVTEEVDMTEKSGITLAMAVPLRAMARQA